MWIIDNNKDVLHKISYLNNKHIAKDVATYDFSTLYTNIPHTQLKKQMKWVLDKAFYNKTHNIYMYLNPMRHGTSVEILYGSTILLCLTTSTS